ncbi:helix-turn-helix domain-containing protein [Terrabacter sp. AAH1]
MARAHRHDDVELALPRGGSAVMEVAGTPYAVDEGRCAVFWAGVPHRLAEVGRQEEAGTAVAWLTVPLVDVLSWSSVPPDFVSQLLRGTVATFAAPPTIAPAMSLLAEEIDAGPVPRAAARREAEAWLLRAAHGARAAAGGRAPEPGSRSARTMASWVARHFREPVAVADVAAVAHLHPSTARAAFRRELGVTITEYLAQCRTAEAQRLLMSSDLTTDEVAVRAGFGSTSRFYARFVQDVGMPPAAYRRRMR